ncbi:MAG: hypothetical protein ABSD62_09545 [Candidatus Limnocylindrales bacterium]|jgi:hypothetical protein
MIDMPFYFFFGILGLVVGGLIVWFLMAEHPFESLETPGGPVDAAEVSLLAKEMADDDRSIDEDTITKLLVLHGAYVDGKIREAQAAAEAARLEAERQLQVQERARKDAV